MESLQIDVLMVKEKLQKLKRHCSPGPDGIANAVLIEACNELAPPLAIIFQKSLHQSSVPADWKSANVTPIHKGGQQKTCFQLQTNIPN